MPTASVFFGGQTAELTQKKQSRRQTKHCTDQQLVGEMTVEDDFSRAKPPQHRQAARDLVNMPLHDPRCQNMRERQLLKREK